MPGYQGGVLRANRREFILGASAAALIGGNASAAFAAGTGPLTIVSHKVHQDVTRGPKYNVEQEFIEGHGGAAVNWLTFGAAEVQDRIFREAVLGNTEVNVGYVLSHWLYPQIAENFLALDDLEKSAPLDRASLFGGMLEAGVVDGRFIAAPVRGNVHMLHYNRRILEERGVEPPKTIEDYVEVSKKCTFDGPDGKIYGNVNGTSVQEIFNSFIAFARAFGEADFVSKDYKVLVASPENLKALELYKELVDADTLPSNWSTYNSTDVIRECRQGRAALTIAPASHYLIFNSDPSVSQEAGNWETVPVPPSREKPDWTMARHNVDFWSMVVPKRGPDPELSWEWIRHMAAADVQTKMALNGNGPVSSAVFESPEWRANAPFADAAAQALAVATPLWTPFERISQAIDALGEEVHACLLGSKSASDALADAAARIERLV